jgi:hypothetical protein
MKTPMAVRRSNLLFNSLMFFSGLTFMLVLLPLIRCLLDGKSYSWGQEYFGMVFNSSGIELDYFILIPFLLLYLVYFYSFYWIKNRTVFYIMLIWFWVHNFGNLLYDIIKNGDTMFRGDTLDVHVSISSIIIPLAIVFLIWITAVIIKDRNMEDVSVPWGNKNKIWLLIVLGSLPIQTLLYATGEPDGLTDEISVFITILQSFLFGLIFIPRKDKA